MRKTAGLLLFAAMMLALLPACSRQGTEKAGGEITGTYTDYIDSGKVFAAQIGDVYGAVANEVFRAKEVQEFTLAPDMLEAVRQGKVDVAILDDAYVKQIQDSGRYPDLAYLPVPKEVFVNMASNVFHTEELRDTFNEWFATILEDGTFDEIYGRWIGASLPAEEDIPRFELTGENGTLKVCNTGNFPPFSYLDSKQRPVGFDEEIVSRFADYLGMDLAYNMMAYDAIIPYVLSGKADMSACAFTATDERSEGVIFGMTYAKAQAVLVIPKGNAASPVRDHTAFAGKDIAVITGVLTVNTTEKIGGNPVEYNDSASAAEDVRKGRVAGYMHALTAVQVMAAQMEGFEVIPVPKEIFAAQIAGLSHDRAVIERFNSFLAAIEADGTLGEMKTRWFSDQLDLDAPIPPIENGGGNGSLHIAVCSDSIPYVYSGLDGELSGFSVELALRFGAYEGKTVNFTDMEFGGLIPCIASKKADLGLANMAITEERKQSVLFTDPFFDEQHGILALAQDTQADAEAVDTSAFARDYTDLAGRNIGVLTGSFFDRVVLEGLNANAVYYQDDIAALEDIRNGRIDGVMYDYSTGLVISSQPGNEVFALIPVPAEIHAGPMGALSGDAEIIESFDAFLAAIEADGTLEEMTLRWIKDNPGSDPPMPEIPAGGTGERVKVAVTGLILPFSYLGENGELKGFCVELALRYGAYTGRPIEFSTMSFEGLIPAISSGKADLGLDAVVITEERKESVLFSEPFYYDTVGVMVLKPADAQGDAEIDYTDFFGKRFAVKNGTIYDAMSRQFEASETLLFEDYTSIYEAVLQGRADAGMRGYWAAYASMFETDYAQLEIVEIPESLHNNPIGAISMNREVIDVFNVFLAELKASGIYDEMRTRWFDEFNPNAPPDMPVLENSGENGTLVIAISSDYMPFSYLGEDGVNLGFDIELAHRFAASQGKRIEFVDMAFSGLLPYVMSGKADIAISDITITEERKQSVLFTDPYFTDKSAIVYKRDYAAAEEEEASGGFIAWLQTGIERNLITDNRWKMVVSGLGVTMTIAVLAQLFGTVAGSLVCWLLMSRHRFVKWLGNLYCGLIYGTPVVVLLMITYYIIFGNTGISNVLVAVAAFTMVTGASVATNLKGAIETVDPVEIEAARSIGFTAFKAFRTVTLPQAIRRALPGYTNGFVELVKATAIVGYIAIQDLTRAGDIIRSRTYDAYFPLLFVAVIYLIVTTICVQVFKAVVKRVNQGGAAQ